ncbi:MAG TPA: CARDB domain-containing protein, partial [Thermomicrobiales bacterium]|nr:CARDB domain-containing protein [Thermomicrobiales bacterium]
MFLQAVTVAGGDANAPAASVKIVTFFNSKTSTGDKIGFTDIVDVRINNLKDLKDDPGSPDPGNRQLNGNETVSFTTKGSTTDRARANVTIRGLNYGERVILRYEVRLRCSDPVDKATGDIRTELHSAQILGRDPIDIGDQYILVKDASKIRTPGITISAACPTVKAGARVGDPLTYNVTIINSGGVPLTGISVSTTRAGSFDTSFPANLDPGEHAERTFTGVITQADADSSSLPNTFKVSTNEGATDSATPACSFTPVAAVTITSACQPVPTNAAVGDDVTYLLTIENTGDTTLSGIALKESRPGTVASLSPTTLSPGAKDKGAFTGTLTQSDFDAGSATLSVHISSSQSAAADATAACTLPVSPDITVSENCPIIPAGTRIGTAIEYPVTIANTGNVTLTGLEVTTSRDGAFDSAFPVSLAPGESSTRTFSSTITTDDASQGTVDFKATVTTEQGAEANTISNCGYTPVADISLAGDATSSESSAPLTAANLNDVIDFDLTITN